MEDAVRCQCGSVAAAVTVRCTYGISRVEKAPSTSLSTTTARLFDRDVETDGCKSISIGSYDDDEGKLTARVEVLKILQLRVAGGVHPDPDRSARRARV